jgi:hypothetical protein
MSEMTRDEALAHFGVKGMKWGVRKENFQRNRALNKASRAKDKADRTAAVDTARARVKSGEAKREYKAVKAQAKADRINIGSREARKIKREARDKFLDEIELSREARDGKELAERIILAYAVESLLRSQVRV